MHAFKMGQATLPDVEKRFQAWQEKHNPLEPLVEKENEVVTKNPVYDVPKRPARKVSDVSKKKGYLFHPYLGVSKFHH